MKEQLDPRIDKMVAFLYGELPEGERRAFERMLERDDALRAEFEELSSVRGALSGWEVEEHAPSFVLVEDRKDRKAAEPRFGLLERFTEWAQGLAGSPAWALAATAVLLIVLAVGGVRVERVDGGIAFRFGGDRPAPLVSDPMPGLGQGQELALGEGPVNADGVMTTVSSDLVTQSDLDTHNEELLMGLMKALNDYGQRRDQETYAMVQSMYQQLRDEQNRDYRQLHGRLDTMGLEVLAARSGVSFEDLLKNGADLRSGSDSGEE
jgi:hypothetical protein